MMINRTWVFMLLRQWALTTTMLSCFVKDQVTMISTRLLTASCAAITAHTSLSEQTKHLTILEAVESPVAVGMISPEIRPWVCRWLPSESKHVSPEYVYVPISSSYNNTGYIGLNLPQGPGLTLEITSSLLSKYSHFIVLWDIRRAGHRHLGGHNSVPNSLV